MTTDERPIDPKKRLAGLLLVLAVVAPLIGLSIYNNGVGSAEADQRVCALGAALDGVTRSCDLAAPKTFVIVGLGVGGMALVFAVLLYAGSSNPERERQSQAVEPSRAPSLATELGDLAQLHSDGVLTDEEYNAAKAKLIGGKDR